MIYTVDNELSLYARYNAITRIYTLIPAQECMHLSPVKERTHIVALLHLHACRSIFSYMHIREKKKRPYIQLHISCKRNITEYIYFIHVTKLMYAHGMYN